MNGDSRFAAGFSRNLRYPAGISAFTLIEILMVVVLLGVVAGLAVPNFSSTYEKFLLGETVKDLSFFMRYAQDRAVIKSKHHRIVFGDQEPTYWMEEAAGQEQDGNTDEKFTPITGRFGRVFGIPEGITLQAAQPHVGFYPDGRIDKIRIYLCNRKNNCFTLSTYEQDGYVQVFDFRLE